MSTPAWSMVISLARSTRAIRTCTTHRVGSSAKSVGKVSTGNLSISMDEIRWYGLQSSLNFSLREYEMKCKEESMRCERSLRTVAHYSMACPCCLLEVDCYSR